MDNPTSPPSTPIVPPQEPFKKWAECHMALNSLPTPLQPEGRDLFVSQVTNSPQKQHIAFEVLCLLLEPKQGSKLRWLEAPMLAVLSGGVEPPKFPLLNIPSEAGKWVREELQDVHTLAHWKLFVASGEHFGILYTVLRATPNKHVLIEALMAFSECAERCHNTDESGKPKKRLVQAADATWIANLLKSKIPAKAELPRTFLESLYAINATAFLSEDIRSENEGLRRRLKITQDELAAVVHAKEVAEQNAKDTQAKLDAANQSLEETKIELSEEKLHTTRQGGFNVVAKRETINHVLSVVRRGINHRLENIRGYADREKPNRDEILALVGEIEEHLAGIEEEVGQ